MKTNNRLIFALIMSVVVLLLLGCSNDTEKETLIIADQFGLAYAPIEIMKNQGFLREALDGAGLSTVTIEWKRLGNTTAIREAMLSEDLDIGFVGIPPFLIGVDNGMDWRIISGISQTPSALIASSKAVDSLEAIDDSTRIIVPQPGSIQHILLSMYAKRMYGDSKKYDHQLVAMSHPDGYTAMRTGASNTLHFTTPPFMQQEMKLENATVLLDGETCFGGPFTFIVGICPERIYDNPKIYTAFKNALEKSIEFIGTYPEDALEVLSESYDYSEADLKAYMDHPQMIYETDVRGLDAFVSFMVEEEMLSDSILNSDLYWGSDNE